MSANRSIAFIAMGDWTSTLCLRARQFGKYLSEQGWRVSYLLPASEENRAVSLSPPFGATIRISRPSIWAFLRDTSLLLRDERPGFVHFLNPELKASLVSILHPRTSIIGDWEDWHAMGRDRGLKFLFTLSSDKFMRWRSSKILVTSRWLAKEFHRLGKRDCKYIPYATLPMDFPELPNPYTRQTATFMGSFNPQWDHDVILKAAKIIKERGLDIPIVLIGGGVDLEKWKRFAVENQLSNVRFTGFLPWDEMLNHLQWARVLLFPIRDKVVNWARCPFKVIQYAQAMRPIITSRVGEVPTFLADNATYVDCTPESFADAIVNEMQLREARKVDYHIYEHSWEDRGSTLLNFLLNTK